MRAGWILLKIRHKQYGVNVDEVGADIIRPQIPQSAALTAPFTREPKKMQPISLPCKGRGTAVGGGGIIVETNPILPNKGEHHDHI